MSQRNRNIVLWVVAIGLLVSMVISFTPGRLFGNRAQQEAAAGPVALNVNGEPIRELQVQRLEQNPPFNAVQEGPAAQDLQLVLLDQLVTQTLLQQAAADVNVSSGEVRTRVNQFREQQGVAGSRNDSAYQNLLAGAGYTDATFRELIRQQLQQEKYLDNLTADTKPTDQEVQTYYEANQSSYQSEPRITAREIVVADESKTNALYALALAGENFTQLARENSTERAEQGGALGAAEGESKPQPVTSVALPTAVSQAAFALQGPGLTKPVQAGGVYHIVKVEAYTPAGTRPLKEVRSEVEKDLTDLQKAAAEENALRTLKASADITSPPESSYQYKNPVVAKVGDKEITAAELDRNTYLNPQIQQLLNPSFAGIIESSVKPNVLGQMIDAQLAVQGAKSLKGTFVGPDSAVAQSALGYVSRDIKVTPAQVQSFYNENKARYTEQPTALTTRVNFTDAASARAFRQALTTADTISTDSIGIAAKAAGGTVKDLGSVSPGAQPGAIDTALFNFKEGMTALGQSGFDISKVLTLEVPSNSASGGTASGGAASGGTVSGGTVSGGTASGGATAAPKKEQFVVLVAARTPERVRPLTEVRAQVEQAALQQRQNEAQQTWLDGLRKKFPVENLLASAQTPTVTQSGGVESGGVESGGTASGGAQGTLAPGEGSSSTQLRAPESNPAVAVPNDAQTGRTQNDNQTGDKQTGTAQSGAAQGQSGNAHSAPNQPKGTPTSAGSVSKTATQGQGVAAPNEVAPGKAKQTSAQKTKQVGKTAANGNTGNSGQTNNAREGAQKGTQKQGARPTKPNAQGDGSQTNGSQTDATQPDSTRTNSTQNSKPRSQNGKQQGKGNTTPEPVPAPQGNGAN